MARLLSERLPALVVLLGLGCGGAPPTATSPSPSSAAPGVTRYRLLLRKNPVDPGQAFRCHGACQTLKTPRDYLDCLSKCPGFEQTPGVACQPNEVPPIAACFTAHPVGSGSEPENGSVVIAVVADVALVVGVTSVCASQTEPCSYTGAGLVP